ncbi:uncharacterized protein B0I36DRAFT_330721 [Microdochium trichocladiopsis]|uniref:F-box domain-containing protein n=1 Tax=Microdochium trichocladiopsis TaxID=1682393 RepID=A0A9P9BR20_9PEZI|nr:uncharacterized protein B0I36DRAFT_330721 [Microdochium trichocladiopsis]KAH7026472.1 hypothetical protein B0I36DRAFT_330721 [Microdochium trichocladiopsis]
MSPSPSPSSCLLRTPVEVLAQIASYLPTTEYCALRRSCKHVEAALFHPFATEFFKRRQFMLTEFSLEALIDISKSRLAPSVEYVTLSTDKPRWDVFRNNLFRHQRLDEYEQALHLNRFSEEYDSHTALITSGRDYEMLLEGLTGLPNLQAIGVRDFHSMGRYRDGGHTKWRPYGSTTFQKQTSIPTESDTSLYRYHAGFGISHTSSPSEEAEMVYLKRVLTTLLRVLGAMASATPISRFEVILRRLALNDHSFSMSPALQSAIFPALGHLKALFLDLCTMAPATKIENEQHSIQSSYQYHLLQLLTNATSLEHLRLNCKNPQSPLAVAELFSWLARPAADQHPSLDSQVYPGLPLLPPSRDFPNLQTVEIGFAFIEPQALIGLCTKLKSSLRAINLHKINLCASTNQQTDKVNLWTRLLHQLSGLDLALNSIVLEEVGQGLAMYNLVPVKFHGQKKMRWSGKATAYGLKDLIDALEIEWPTEAPMDHRDLDEYDEDEDEDDEDDADIDDDAMGGMADDAEAEEDA